MKYLSFTTLKELYDVPHSYICREMGLSRYTFNAMSEGRRIHRIIQDHVSNAERNSILDRLQLPNFDIVEQEDFDPKCKIEFEHREDVCVFGYFDGYSTETSSLLEIKSSKTPWGLPQFYRLMQWRIYALGLLHRGIQAKDIYFATMPRDVMLWNDHTVKLYRCPIKDDDIQKAINYIDGGLDIIKNIKDEAYKPTKIRCNYKGCPFGCETNKQQPE